MEEYTDEPTGIRMTVERDAPYTPEQPRVTIYPPEPCNLEPEEINAAIHRLIEMSAKVVYEWHAEEQANE